MSEPSRSGINKLIENTKNLVNSFVSSYLRGGMPDSDRSKTAVIVNNFVLSAFDYYHIGCPSHALLRSFNRACI